MSKCFLKEAKKLVKEIINNNSSSKSEKNKALK